MIEPPWWVWFMVGIAFFVVAIHRAWVVASALEIAK
jgi:hypothetical protein